MKLIEIHIAVPRMDEQQTTILKDILGTVGIPKTKYFQGVRDYKPITEGCTNGHDISSPGTMSTVKVETLEEGMALVSAGMAKVKELGIKGANFEIEQVLISDNDNVSFDESTMSEFQVIPNAPQSENHLLYKGTASEIPTDQEIIDMCQRIGLAVNQVVDFSHERDLQEKTIISRVATIYQLSQAEATRVDKILKINRDSLRKPRVVTERVLMVGEYRTSPLEKKDEWLWDIDEARLSESFSD